MARLASLSSAVLLGASLLVPSIGSASSIYIYNTDDRGMTDAWCDIDYYISSWHTYDWEAIDWAFDRQTSMEVDDYRCTCDGYECSGDCLYTVSSTSIAGRTLVIRKVDSYTYNNLRVACEFYIGDRHYDWQDLGNWDGSSDIYLELNGGGGTWNDENQCWEGDFLQAL
ncbi:MAG TPA: hypothetical protein VKP30_03145 [Polyangiaceae bacterium]|nr:hypothetical protein [Polyangiaceae bacterium]